MFKNEFQGGPYFEIFSAQAKDAVSHWRLSSSGIKKDFDKEVRSFVFVVEGSAVTTRMCIPRDTKNSLGLIQRFLVLQVYIPKGLDFSVDLGVSDLGNQKRRLVLSTTHKELQTNPLHSKIPLAFIRKAKWLNLCLDLLSLVGDTWHSQTYKCIDSVCITGNCRLRRIFTMRSQPPDTTDYDEMYGFPETNSGVDIDSIPKQCRLAPDVPQDVQVITMMKVQYFEGKGRSSDPPGSRNGPQPETDLNSSGGKRTSSNDAYHIAFGTKMFGMQPRTCSGKEANSSARQSKATVSTRLDGSVDGSVSSHVPLVARNDNGETTLESANPDKPASGSRRDRKNSDPGAKTQDPEIAVDKESLRTSHTWTDGADNKESIPFVKPHPPRQPSSDQRRRPRVKSAGKERTPHAFSRCTDDSSSQSVSSSAHSSLNSSNSQSQSVPSSASQTHQHDPPYYERPNIVANDAEMEQIMKEIQEGADRDYRRSETESEPSSNNTSGGHGNTSGSHGGDDSISEVIQALNHQRISDQRISDLVLESERDIEDIDLTGIQDGRKKSKVYTFSSKPMALKPNMGAPTSTRSQRPRTRRKTPADGHRKEAFGRHLHVLQPSGDTIRSFVDSSSSGEEQQDVDDSSHFTPRAGHGSANTKKISRTKLHLGPKFSEIKQPSFSVQSAFGNNGLLQVAPVTAKSPYSSQTTRSVSRRSLREIPLEELRKSVGQKPYNSTKYEMVDLSDSFEARMLESMRREQLEGQSSSEEDHHRPRNPSDHPDHSHHPNYQQLDSLSGSSDDTDMSTLKNTPKPNANNYHEEMKILSQEFLTQSNPRDWSIVMSPPIIPPKENQSSETLVTSTLNTLKPDYLTRDGTESDGDGELDLLYDPVLNCYYDPKSCKYYELV